MAYVTKPEWLPHAKDIPSVDGKFATFHFLTEEEATSWFLSTEKKAA